MNVTSLQHKTVRPGSLAGYSYYHSSRRPVATAKAVPRLGSEHNRLLRRALVAALVLLVLIVGPLLRGGGGLAKQAITADSKSSAPVINQSGSASGSTTPAAPAAAALAAPAKPCTGQSDKLVLVSISRRHLWACQGSRQVYDSPVITGIAYLPADATPTGTYHIYGKQTNTTLSGSDTTGSWSDPVQYWMPFLHNQYGSYGFHDATWRPANAFGNTDPSSSNASHGCVEVPLATSKWLYGWTAVGTAVTIEN